MKTRNTRLFLSAGLATLALLPGLVQAETRITSLFADRTAGKLFIEGKEFKKGLVGSQKVYVEIDGQALVVNASATMDDHIEAVLPPLADGEYQVFVSRKCAPGLFCLTPDPHTVTADQRTTYSLSLPNALVGPQGPAGEQGPQGEIGPVGAKGDAGPQGLKGDTGAQGAKGDTGVQGAKGDTGVQGAKGDTGLQGVKGDTGPQGLKGDTGAQGVAGVKGDTGPTGLPGLKGDTGAQGAKGDTGLQGAKGDTGLQGLKGDSGPQGLKGDTGAQGVAGVKGDTGSTGAQGPQGVQGPKGDAGATGAQGPKGDTGATGAQGPQGPGLAFNQGPLFAAGTVGGPGGTPFGPHDCAPGSIAVGFLGRAGDDIDVLELRCRSFDDVGILGPVLGAEVSGGSTGNPLQGTSFGGALRCPSGSALTGIQARVGSAGDLDIIDVLAARCTTFGSGAVTTTEEVGISSGSGRQNLDCPSGSTVVGFDGRKGFVFDAVGLRCRSMQ